MSAMDARIREILQQVRAGLSEGHATHNSAQVRVIGEAILSEIEERLSTPRAAEPAIAALADATVYVVVASYGAPPDAKYRRLDGNRVGPIVFETDIEDATIEKAHQRAAHFESQLYGACRIARLVFEDTEGRPL